MTDIDYGNILSRSFEITKKSKWLWIFGLALAITTGGGFNSGGNLSGGSGNFNFPKKIPQDLPDKASNILGQSSTAIVQWFEHVPVTTWIMLALGLFTLVLVYILVSLIIQSWAKAGLIYGINEGANGKEVKLPDTSRFGMGKIRPLILYGLIALGIGIATVVIAAAIVALGSLLLSFARGLLVFWLIGCTFVVGGSLLVLFIIYAMIAIYAERLIVLYGYAPWRAWKKAFSMSKRNFFPTLSMGVINMAVGCTAGCLSNIALLLVLGIPAALLLMPSFKNGLHLPGAPTISMLLALFMLFVWANYVIRAILVVFNYGVWNLFFREIVKKEGNV